MSLHHLLPFAALCTVVAACDAKSGRTDDGKEEPWEETQSWEYRIEKEEYALEYGTDLLEIHKDAIAPGERVLVVDDVLATGGTASAVVRLVERLGGEVIGLAFLIELLFLHGRDKLDGHRLHAVVDYS